MATILKRSGSRGIRWQAKVRRTGRPTISKTFRRKVDAETWAGEVERDLRLGRFVSSEAEERTLADLVDRYGREVLDERQGDSEKRRQQLGVWRDRLGHRRLLEITPPVIGEERDNLKRQDGFAPSTVNRYLAALSHAFSIAVREWSWTDENPVKKVGRLREPRGRVRYLDEDEQARLLSACEESDDERLHLIVLIAISNGMRQAEVLGLTWSDVDFERRQVTAQETKNGERRTVPLTGRPLELLKERNKVRHINRPYVFAVRDSGPPAFPRRAWLEALERAAITDFRFHDLRHTAASYLAMNGATLMEIAEVLGHKSLQMVRRYAHLSQAHTLDVVESMNRRFLGDGAAASHKPGGPK